jgi:hypothetical protein
VAMITWPIAAPPAGGAAATAAAKVGKVIRPPLL